MLICEYTAFADELIQEIKQKQLFSDKKIVLLSSLIDRNPYPEYEFVFGVPISPQALLKAHADKASHIFVFSNNRFTEPDTKTLHILSRITKLNSHASLFVELENEHHPLLAKITCNPVIMKRGCPKRMAFFITAILYFNKHDELIEPIPLTFQADFSKTS